METDGHCEAWRDRHGADYDTDGQRRAAYRDFKANLARLTEMFSRGDEDSAAT
jgi:hypothetical protein